MNIRWTDAARDDVVRLEQFLRQMNEQAAARAVQMIVSAPEKLLQMPRLGTAVEGYEPHEVRRLIVGTYELRYELVAEGIAVLRVWHTREDR